MLLFSVHCDQITLHGKFNQRGLHAFFCMFHIFGCILWDKNLVFSPWMHKTEAELILNRFIMQFVLRRPSQLQCLFSDVSVLENISTEKTDTSCWDLWSLFYLCAELHIYFWHSYCIVNNFITFPSEWKWFDFYCILLLHSNNSSYFICKCNILKSKTLLLHNLRFCLKDCMILVLRATYYKVFDFIGKAYLVQSSTEIIGIKIILLWITKLSNNLKGLTDNPLTDLGDP